MRALLLAVVVLGTGCVTDTLSEDTAYRRLVDNYESEAQCLSSGLGACYQTLTLCTNGLVRLDLVSRPEDGEYKLADSSVAVAQFVDRHVEFDLETKTSAQLPGRHAWSQVEVIAYDCQP